mgnify:CR=1 FL=1
MEFIAIHDGDADHLGFKGKFPNYALMKISAYHKARGDQVEWFNPMFAEQYDRIYSSKIFDFTTEDQYLPERTIKGGTGYGKFEDLPEEIDRMFPDYSLYPECDYAIGFITRGCPNKCPHCYVPQKEGYIKPYRTWQEVVRQDTKKLVLMDNNILAHPHGIDQLRQLAETDYRIDINQAMSCFLVTDEIADILSKIKWIKYIRFSVDRKPQIEGVYKAAEKLTARGIPTSKLFLYCLLTDDLDDNLERIYAMRKLKNVTLYGMPYADMRKGVMPQRWQKIMAQKYIYSGQWRTSDWEDWKKTHNFYFKEEL